MRARTYGNPQRAKRAHGALADYYEVNRIRPAKWERPQAVGDLLADLRHYCDKHGLDFTDLDRQGLNHYTAEKDGSE